MNSVASEAPPVHAATVAATLASLIAFAANSLLCRAALATEASDPASFCCLRLFSGAVFLFVVARRELVLIPNKSEAMSGDLVAAVALFIYAIAFSCAYRHLTAGSGALILFGAVQVTMFLGGWRRGERPNWREAVAWVIALGGLVLLVWPRVTAPPLIGSALMGAAGAAWGVYSLRGRGVARPIVATAGNFVRAAPLAAVAWLIAFDDWKLTARGALLAMISGVVTSGLGYVIWYRALRGLTAVRAAVLQLSVPVLAALAGVVFLGEHLTLHLAVAGSIVLSGIGLAIAGRQRGVVAAKSAAGTK